MRISSFSLIKDGSEITDFSKFKEGEIEVLMNRGSVSAAVPQQVFGKAESGARDFMRIICLTDNQALKAYCYVMAYKCYKNCDKETQALLALQEAEKLL